jgi:hypothetical protein
MGCAVGLILVYDHLTRGEQMNSNHKSAARLNEAQGILNAASNPYVGTGSKIFVTDVRIF